jgi:hypothetical protein
MYRILSRSEPGVVGIKIESKLNRDEYELLNFYLEHLTKDVGPVNILCDMTECEGLKSHALWEEMTGHLPEVRDHNRIAIVGGQPWEEDGLKEGDSWLNSQLKFFTRDQIDDAWNWVKG